MTAPSTLTALVVHARDVPAADREAFAVSVHDGLGSRAFTLETCHRVEAYLTADPGKPAATAALGLPSAGRVLIGDAAVRHAIAVAVGADSVVAGEDQILHQLRVSVDRARASGALDPVLERLFSIALQAGRRARSWQQGPRRSLADVGFATIEERRGSIRGLPVLVVGAGEMGRLGVRAAVRAGATVSVASRSDPSAARVARLEHVDATTFDPGEDVGRFAAVMIALRGPWAVSEATSRALATNRMVVVDLSVPAAVPVATRRLLGDRLVTADDLARTDGPAAARSSARIERLIDDATRSFLDWLASHDARAAAEALVRRADRAREAELAALWERVPDLDPDARDAIDAMTRHLAGRLLREPLERLGRDADGEDGRAVREIFAL